MVTKELSEPAKKDKKDVRANFYLGNLHLDQKEWKKAIKHYLKAARHGEKRS
ncbi:unnamed protein product [marine sediment metagenome]|uniref:Uncharacterized protein n=1 Tax=marine sediment metagenome TaxID=412755 RepID=X1ERH1_9ZZZZ